MVDKVPVGVEQQVGARSAVDLGDKFFGREANRVRLEPLRPILPMLAASSEDVASALDIPRKAVEAPTFVVSYDARRTSFAALEVLLKEALA